MEKGEIYLARDREKHYHPIVFLEQIDIVRFKACIISTKSTNGNIPMLHEHFYMNDENGANGSTAADAAIEILNDRGIIDYEI